MPTPEERPDFQPFPVKPGKTYGLMAIIPTRTESVAVQTEKQVQ